MNKKYLDLAIANELIGTIGIERKDKDGNIIVKEYAQVNERIKAFRMVYPNGVIFTNMLSNENGVCIFKAQVGYYEEDGSVCWLGEGHAYEKEDSSFINKTSYIENCETSAVGRALGMCGFGIDVSVASAEEIQNAIENQKITKEEADTYTLNFGKYNGKTIKEIFEIDRGYIEWLLANTNKEDIKQIIELSVGLKIPSPEEQKKRIEMISIILGLVDEKEVDLEKIYEGYKVNGLDELTLEQMNEVYEKLRGM